MTDNGNGRGSTGATRARAIESQERRLDELLADIHRIRDEALGRIWKGNPHPDYVSALKAVELEARLLRLLDAPAKGSGKEGLLPTDDTEFLELARPIIERAGYRLEKRGLS